jgi:Dolichyl-phosphate-mannose-protein mannosyltransferase
VEILWRGSAILAERQPHPMRFIDAVWLLALAIFVLVGAPLVSFHGDETIQVYNSHDYATAFIEGRPLDLVIDFSQPMSAYYLRIHDSSIPRYSIGLSWHLAGLSESDLPSRGWNWSESYNRNLELGLRPSPPLLNAARLALSLFLAGSSAVMFAIGWRFGRRPLAYFVSALYTLNPIILLNGRRAIQDAPLLCFGLLTLFIVATISQKRTSGQKSLKIWWLALMVASGLTLLSKNSGFIYIASAYGWIFVAELTHFNFRAAVGAALRLAACGLMALVMLVMFSPGLWGDPLTGFQKMVAVRVDQMEIQTRSVGGASSMGERISALVMQPYLTPVWHYELTYWGSIRQIKAEIEHYMASPLSGIQFGRVGGLLLTLLALIGLVMMFRPRLNIPLSLSVGVLAWLAVNVVVLLVNPVLWQRYYVALIPIMSLLSGLGVMGVIRFLGR